MDGSEPSQATLWQKNGLQAHIYSVLWSKQKRTYVRWHGKESCSVAINEKKRNWNF